MNQPVIQTQALSKTYEGVAALQTLDLCVPQNAIFGFLGPNGAGKTTTMKLLLGLIRPTSGGGTIFGHDIIQDNLAIRARVGYLPQQPQFYKEMTAWETLRFTASFFYKGPKARLEERIREMLHLVGLEEKAQRPVGGFSGGERQRLGIAQAQINYPDLLILDEPAAALDPLGRRDVLHIMERLRQYTTIFYSTHILDDVQQVSDTVAILNRGQLVTQGPIETLLNGSGQTIYNVGLKGNSHDLYQKVAQQPWVSHIEIAQQNGVTQWEVAVTDETAAEQQFFRLLAGEEHMVVTEYGRKQYELEEIFMQLVEGDNDDR
ncbi:MAG: ABC transporter ATP-binding protein [Ardenticatenaceae bacterium]|nr:ABC transporter ATP-binding protein [Ardenticatenaceae bacterium]